MLLSLARVVARWLRKSGHRKLPDGTWMVAGEEDIIKLMAEVPGPLASVAPPCSVPAGALRRRT